MFKSLRKNEFESILQKYYGKLPDVTQFQYYKECLKWFEKLDIQYLQEQTANILKKRNKIIETNDLFEIPMELKYLIYFSALTSGDIKKITFFLKEKNNFEEEV